MEFCLLPIYSEPLRSFEERSFLATFSVISLMSWRPFSLLSRYLDLRNLRATLRRVVSFSYDDSCWLWPIRTNWLRSFSTQSIWLFSQFLTSLSDIWLKRLMTRSLHMVEKVLANSTLRVLFKFRNGFSNWLVIMKGNLWVSTSASRFILSRLMMPFKPPMSVKYWRLSHLS